MWVQAVGQQGRLHLAEDQRVRKREQAVDGVAGRALGSLGQGELWPADSGGEPAVVCLGCRAFQAHEGWDIGGLRQTRAQGFNLSPRLGGSG